MSVGRAFFSLQLHARPAQAGAQPVAGQTFSPITSLATRAHHAADGIVVRLQSVVAQAVVVIRQLLQRDPALQPIVKNMVRSFSDTLTAL